MLTRFGMGTTPRCLYPFLIHDLKLFHQSGVQLPHQTALIEDAGYQGLWRSHGHAITTHQATLASLLSAEQRQHAAILAHTRRGIEHVIRRMKIFRVLGACTDIGGVSLRSGFSSSQRCATLPKPATHDFRKRSTGELPAVNSMSLSPTNLRQFRS